MSHVDYIHLPAGSEFPTLREGPKRVLLLTEDAVSTEWQTAACHWIFASNCLYFMSWGVGCEDWHDGLDSAFLSSFQCDFCELPEDKIIYTTWHSAEPMHEVFFFARCCAYHPTVPLPNLTILDVRSEDREEAILALHKAECAGLLEDTFDDAKDPSIQGRN